MKLAALALAAAAAPVATPTPEGSAGFEVEPAPLAWERLSPAVFDLAWCLPDEAPGRDLTREMAALLDVRFDATDRDGRRLRCFGDVAAAARALPPAERRAWFEDLRARAPRFLADWGEGLSQLLLDDQLYADDWDPERDLPRDGLLTADSWSLRDAGPGPWQSAGAEPRVEQLATLVFADLTAIKAAENDYRAYFDNVGAEYEAIHPVDGSYFRGTCPRDNEFAALRLYFASDLPFPFGGYSCDLRILNRVDARGRVVTDIYSTSDDFHYLAGRDVFLPVETSGGDWVAFLLVRCYGFDIDDVPDKPKHRRLALRSSVGNLRRRAEAAFSASGGVPRDLDRVPGFRVLGRR